MSDTMTIDVYAINVGILRAEVAEIAAELGSVGGAQPGRDASLAEAATRWARVAPRIMNTSMRSRASILSWLFCELLRPDERTESREPTEWLIAKAMRLCCELTERLAAVQADLDPTPVLLARDPSSVAMN